MTPRFNAAVASRFGDAWPGVRCGAKTRSGQPCKNPIVTGRKRCRMHGGAKGSGAPSGERNGRFLHGRYTKKRMAIRKQEASQLKSLERLGRELGLYKE
jgi:hypothetical protein